MPIKSSKSQPQFTAIGGLRKQEPLPIKWNIQPSTTGPSDSLPSDVSATTNKTESQETKPN